MINSNEFEVKRNTFLTYLSRMDDAVAEYVNALKKKSSEELLNGSASAAKDYLDEILLLETNTKNFTRLINNIKHFIDRKEIIESETEVHAKAENSVIEKTNASDSNNAYKTLSEKVWSVDRTNSSDNINLIEDHVEETEKPAEIKAEKTETQVKKTEEKNTNYDTQAEDVKKETKNYDTQAEDVKKETKNYDTQAEDIDEVNDTVKRSKDYDTKIPILKSLIYLGGIANEEELNKYMKQYNGRNGDKTISINELKVSLDLMIENEMVSVDPLDDNIEILQNGIDYLASNEA